MRPCALAMLVSVHLGCLLPAPVDEMDIVPNLPPQIDLGNMTPDPTDGPREMTTRCPAYQFFAGVDDPDPSDTIYWRVFLDYHRQQDGTLLATEVRNAKPGAVLNFTVDPSDRRFFTTGTFSQIHVVELYIADRPFNDIPRKPYGRNVEEPGLVDSFVWAVDLSTTRDCVTGDTQ